AAGVHLPLSSIGQRTLTSNLFPSTTLFRSNLTITPATLSVTAAAKSKVYGASDPALTYVASGFKFTDDEASVLTGALSRAAGEQVADYTTDHQSRTANSCRPLRFTDNNLTI